MIRFGLTCGHGHEFEGWFRDGRAFDEQAAAGSLTCPLCADTSVRKAVMAPAIARGHEPPAPTAAAATAPAAASGQALRVLRQLRSYVERNFDYVGPRFPDEARRMHQGEIEHRGIYGEATPDEARLLREEGVAISPLPPVPKLDG